MAQTGFTPILTYASGTASNVPLAANLTSSASGAELALNYADGRLFYKDSGGVVQVLATKATGSIGGSNTQVQFNSSGSLAGSANMTFNGTRLTVADLADSGLTAGRVVYVGSGSALVDSAALTFDGTLFSTTGGISLGAGTNLTWGGAYGAGIPTIAGSSGALLFYPNGSTSGESMRLNSSGNLGLGVTPSAWGSGFKVLNMAYATVASENSQRGQAILVSNAYNSGTANSPTWIYTSNARSLQYRQDLVDGTHAWFNAASGTAGNAITFTQAMTLDASGRLGVGVTSPAQALQVSGRIRVSTDNTGGGDIAVDSTGLAFSTLGTTQPIVFLRNNFATESARITSGGAFLVATTNTNETQANGFIVLGTATAGYVAASMAGSTNGAGASYHLYSTGAGAYRFYVGLGGTVFATSTTISAISDQRLKENIQDLDAGLDKIMALKPRKFDWKAGKGKDIKDDRGFIAQEFEQVFPDLIDEWKDPAPEGEEPYKSVRADLIPVLVKAIQEQQALITSLTARIAALEAK